MPAFIPLLSSSMQSSRLLFFFYSSGRACCLAFGSDLPGVPIGCPSFLIGTEKRQKTGKNHEKNDFSKKMQKRACVGLPLVLY
jgi:hypothetical protein